MTTDSAPAALGSRTGALARRPASASRLRIRALPYLLIAPTVLVIAAVMGYPLATLGSLSLQHYGLTELIAHQGTWIGLENYQSFVSDPLFWQVVERSIVVTAVCVGASMVLATLLALLLTRVSTPVRLLLSGGLVFVWATPVVVAIDVWQWMVDFEFGVFNWLLTWLHVGNFTHHNWFENPIWGFSVICALVVWGALPFLVITLYAGLAQVPQDVVEAAESDGANGWQIFWRMTVPILRPLFLIMLSLSTIWDFQMFNQVWIMLHSRPSSDYYVMGVYAYVESFRTDQFGRGAAIALLMVFMLMLATVFYVRQMVRTGEVDR